METDVSVAELGQSFTKMIDYNISKINSYAYFRLYLKNNLYSPVQNSFKSSNRTMILLTEDFVSEIRLLVKVSNRDRDEEVEFEV